MKKVATSALNVRKNCSGQQSKAKAAGAAAQVLVGLESNVVGTVRGQGHQRHHPDEYRVPIEDARLRAEFERGPERLEEIAGGIERNAAHNVAQRRPEEHRQQNAGAAEDHVEEVLPDQAFDVTAQFNSDAAQNEQPQHNRQREVKPAEARRVELRECKIQRAAGGEQPDFVAVPDRTYRAQHPATFVVSLGRNQINRARAQIKSVEHDISRNHRGDNPEPKAGHVYLRLRRRMKTRPRFVPGHRTALNFPAGAGTGPESQAPCKCP